MDNIAVLVHSYYIDETVNLLKKMNWLEKIRPKIHVTLPQSATIACVEKIEKSQPNCEKIFKKIENHGFDIAGLTTHFNDEILKYDLVLKIHGKKSEHNSELNKWLDHIYECILSDQSANEIIKYFNEMPNLGLVGPQHYYKINGFTGWGANYHLAKYIAKKMIIDLPINRPDYFPAGSMFWFRPLALKNLLRAKITSKMFQITELADRYKIFNDGTLAHAIERIIGTCVISSSYKVGYCRNPHEVEAMIKKIPESYIDLKFYSKQRRRDFKNNSEALKDYMKIGESIDVSPNLLFKPSEYRELNKDLEKINDSLLYHYHVFGASENRKFSKKINNDVIKKINPDLNNSKTILEKILILRGETGRVLDSCKYGYPVSNNAFTSIARYTRTEGSLDKNSFIDLMTRLFKSCIISIYCTHRNPFSEIGGAEKFLLKQIVENSKSIIVWPSVNSGQIQESPIGYYDVYIVESKQLVTIKADLLKIITTLLSIEKVFINHLMGFDIEFIKNLIAKCKGEIILYLHDFYVLCPQSHFMFRGELSCNAPKFGVKICSICTFGLARERHKPIIQEIFELLRDAHDSGKRCFIISNSQFTEEKIKDSFPEINKISKVINPVKIDKILKYNDTEYKEDDKKKPLRNQGNTICFAGLPVPHKGFDKFAELTLNPKLINKYNFVIVTHSSQETNFIKHNAKWIKLKEYESLANGIKQISPDFLVIIPNCLETFSIVTLEGIAAGVKILTTESTGNVANLVREYKSGFVFSSFDEMCEHLEGGAVNDFGSRRLGTVIFNRID